MKCIHAADIHFDPRNIGPALQALGVIADTAQRERIDLIIIAGDLFDSPIRNSSADSMPALLDACAALLAAAPVVSVQGTPSHDAPGCYDPIVRMGIIHHLHDWLHIDAANAAQVHVLANGFFFPPSSCSMTPTAQAMITGLPEPSRGWLGTKDATGKLQEVLAGIGAATHERTVPHIHVQHGEVRGATLPSGQVLPPGGIAVGTDDLALTGADYIALGHIHTSQYLTRRAGEGVRQPEVVYAGSAYPTDWGEADEKSFIVANITDASGHIHLRNVPYGHPQRQKVRSVVIDPARAVEWIDTMPRSLYGGNDVWIVFQVPADWSGDQDALIAAEARARGVAIGALSVRVTIEREARERVRVPELRAANGWAQQAQQWADHTDTPLRASHSRFITALEAEARKDGAIPPRRRWRLKSIRLRGSIGVWRGSGEDELTVDFGSYAPGVIAVVGPNGAGKTTLIENCTPWPSMLTRGGPLQQHFRLRDSVRELVIVDDQTDDEFQCLIQIDAQSGKREHRVYRQGEPLGADGTTAEYERIVDELWGPRPLHMLSVVSPQRPVTLRVKGDDGETLTVTTDLAAASRGMRRALLRQLLGLGAYQAASRTAHLKSQASIDLAADRRHEAKRHDDAADRARDSAVAHHQATNDRSRCLQAAAHADTELSRHRQEHERLAKEAEASRAARARAADLKRQSHEAEQRLLQIEAQISDLSGPDRREEHARALIELEDKDARMREMQAHHKVAEDEWREARGTADAEVARLEIKLATIGERRKSHSSAIAALDRQRDELDGHPEECPSCGQQLPYEALQRLDVRRTGIVEERKALVAARDADRASFDDVKYLSHVALAGVPASPIIPDELEQLERSAGHRRIKRATLQDAIRQADQADAKREALEQEKERVNATCEASLKMLHTAQEEIHEGAENAAYTASERVGEASQTVTAARVEVAAAERDLAHARADLERCQKADEQRKALLAEADVAQKKADEYGLVASALGPDGLQSLLIEHAVPRIAEVATDLLTKSYGARWRVRIDLQRTGGAGVKRKMIEDVRIIVADAQSSESFGDDDLDPGEQLLETLSGGEGVWIRAALMTAIAHVRAERSGVEWRTVLLDEADAALDESASASYWRLVEASHDLLDRHHTVAITHSGSQHGFEERIEMGRAL